MKFLYVLIDLYLFVSCADFISWLDVEKTLLFG